MTKVVYQIKLYEIKIIQYLVATWNTCAFNWNLPPIYGNDLNFWNKIIADGRMDSQFKTLNNIMTDVGNYLRYPFALLLAMFAAIVYSKHAALKFKTIFNMKRIKLLEQQNWPQITPIVDLNLVKEDIN